MPSSASLKQNQLAARDVNRMLLTSVRTDWSYPNLPSEAHPNPEAQLPGEPTSYRERFYGVSDDADSDSSAEEEDSEDTEEEEELKFESPDDVALFVDRKIQRRRRKRLQALEDELKWNEGLCLFMKRRNAWTAAVPPDSIKSEVEPLAEKSEENCAPKSESQDSEPQTDESEGETIERLKDETEEKTEESTSPQSSPLSEPVIPTPSSSIETPTSLPLPSSSLTNVLIPIATPLVPPTHRIRLSLTSRPDLELYEKLVVDGSTPLVPINLKHMIQVMVSGWKNDGNWPPKGTGMVNNIVLPDTASVGSAFGRAKMSAKGFKQGVESVRRALRLSGSSAPTGD